MVLQETTGLKSISISLSALCSDLACSALLFYKISFFKLTEQYQFCEAIYVGSTSLFVHPVSHIISPV